MGTLPDKWKLEWVRRYKSSLKTQEKRTDLSSDQQKTIAAKAAWDAVKKQGCRLSSSARPDPRRAVYVPPNKRARDRDKKYQKWVCPEWDSTEQAREKVLGEIRREAKAVERRERKRTRVAEKSQRARGVSERKFARSKKKVEHEVAKRQTPGEYSESFRRKHGAYGLLPTEPKTKGKKRGAKKRAPTYASIRARREHAPKVVKEFDARKTYKVGDIISHHRYGYGEVVKSGEKVMVVKFEKATERRTKREIKVGRKTAV